MNIVLCGLPMCGKTAVGKLLADDLKWDFIDTDRLIENTYFQQTGKQSTCRRIYREEGESFFRKMEKQEIASLNTLSRCVIATGGGGLCDSQNIQALQSIGELIYLEASMYVLWERIQSQSIPAYVDVNDPEKTFYDICSKRMPIYENAAHRVIETCHLSEHEVATLILNTRKG